MEEVEEVEVTYLVFIVVSGPPHSHADRVLKSLVEAAQHIPRSAVS